MTNNILLQGVVGSTAYNLATPDSDTDRLGVYAAPSAWFFSLDRPQETMVTTSPDLTLHEVEKFCRLALKCNPSVLELLWLDSYEIATPWGLALLEIRSSFLSRKLVRDAYFGYACGQLTRMLRGQSDRLQREKNARHVLRLLHQGFHLYVTGDLKVRLDDTQVARIRRVAHLAVENNLDFLTHWVEAFEDWFDAAKSPLPEQGDKLAVNYWLGQVRRHYLDD